MMLAKLGHECDIAANGFEALEAIKVLSDLGQSYSIILMDIQMPEMDGFEATDKIYEIYGENYSSIIAMTANAFKEDRDKCKEVGMDDFIAKPIDIKELKRVLGQYSSKQKIDDMVS